MVPGDFHDCPGFPSISTAAPFGTDETINWPSAGAGGATGAAGALLGALADRDEAAVAETPRVLIFPPLPCPLNGAAELAAEFATGPPASSSGAADGRRCKISASPTTRNIPPTTSPVKRQWFVAGGDFLAVVFAGAGSP